jgi:uncharacterized protein YaiL (DUF2058 family)
LTNSLHEQLLKAGLIDEKKLQQAHKAKQRKEKAQRHSKQKQSSASSQLAKQAMAKEAAKHRDLNLRKQQQLQRKAVMAQIQQLIESNRVELEEGEIPYHFTDQGKIRRLYVTEQLHGQISRGQMAIVKLADRYAIVPSAVADKIGQRDPSCVILLHDNKPMDDPNDPYAEFKVPDDLIW